MKSKAIELRLRHPLTGVPAERMMELREKMAEKIGLQLVNVMLDNPDCVTGATVFVEKNIEFEGETETNLGIPVMEIKVRIDPEGNSYLHDRPKVKQPTEGAPA